MKSLVLSIGLYLLDNVYHHGVQLLRLLQATNLANDGVSIHGGHLLGELRRLLIALDVLETERHLSGIKKAAAVLAQLRKRSSGSNESLLSTKLSEGSTADALDGILKMGVANAGDDLLDVRSLLLLRGLVLGGDQVGGVGQSLLDLSEDLLILQGVVDGALLAVVSVVGGGGVASVDSVQLTLDEGLEVLYPVDAVDWGVLALEGQLLHNPLVELLELDVEASVGLLRGDNSVDSRVGVAGTLVVTVEALCRGVLRVLDVIGKGGGGVDHVLASNDSERLEVVGTLVDALSDDRCDELEDGGANRAGDNIGICDDVFCCALGADLDDLVLLGGVQLVHNFGHDIGKDDLISAVVQEAGDEATANVASAKVNGLERLVRHCDRTLRELTDEDV
ncbi:hypothetical protein FJTKL_13324 [Diaporthe vaccinii]|uniref:NAD-specific glutamate dehydrogenase n=1 Tax=Diaporthe vaccinii TaxID=105482 RepID=A0ABR4EB48_9PEZI